MSQKTDYTAWHQDQPDEGLDKAVERIEGRGKAILVIDRMPLSCNVCRLRAWDENLGEYCTAHRPRKIQEYMDESVRPDWCPLIPAIGYVEPVGNMISWEDEE